jgi:serine/threonine protein kinase
MIGITIGGRYQIIKELGKGGFGETYLAQDIKIPGYPKCVVKKLNPRAKDDATVIEAKRLFTKEAEILARLGNHSQIPSLLAYYPDELCLVQEFIQGHDLKQEIVRQEKVEEDRVISMVKEVLHILAFVHQNNVIHRDIKPSNIIRRESDNKLVLIDFGAVKEITGLQATTDGDTVFSIAICTPGYGAPEQQLGKPRLNSDIYALGIMAIEALTGESPTQIQEDRRMSQKILEEETTIQPKFSQIIDKMVRAEWRERYQSVQEVLQAFDSPYRNSKKQLSVFIKIGIVAAGIGLLWFLIPRIRAIYLFNKANDLEQKKQYVEALATYNEVLKIFPNSAKAWYVKAYTLSKLKRIDEMLDSCDRAIKLDPKFVDALNCKGVAFNDLKRYEEAIQAYEQLLEIEVDDYDAWNNKGETLLKVNKPEEALESFNKAILYKPDFTFAWNNRGNTLFLMKLYPEAIAAYTKAIELNPKYYYALNGRGKSQKALGRYELALEDYESALQIKNDFYEGLYNKALVQILLKQNQEALKNLEAAIRIKPDYTEAIRAREEVLKKLGK